MIGFQNDRFICGHYPLSSQKYDHEHCPKNDQCVSTTSSLIFRSHLIFKSLFSTHRVIDVIQSQLEVAYVIETKVCK